MQGNPSLNPEFSHNLNLSANLNKDKFSITPAIYYQRKEDLINQFIYSKAAEGKDSK